MQILITQGCFTPTKKEEKNLLFLLLKTTLASFSTWSWNSTRRVGVWRGGNKRGSLHILLTMMMMLMVMMGMMMVAATMADQTGGAVMNMEMTDSAHLVARFVVDDIIIVVTIIIVITVVIIIIVITLVILIIIITGVITILGYIINVITIIIIIVGFLLGIIYTLLSLDSNTMLVMMLKRTTMTKKLRSSKWTRNKMTMTMTTMTMTKN